MAETVQGVGGGGRAEPVGNSWLQGAIRYSRHNLSLVVGICMLLVLVLIPLIGRFFTNVANAQATSVIPSQAPGAGLPLGSDSQGRDLFAVLVVGLPQTLFVGFLAGIIGLGVGVILGFVAGYRGGVADAVIRMIVDCFLTVPGLLVLVTVAASLKGFISPALMAVIVGSLAWTHPTRTIRSQVLTLRERAYLQVARFSGMGPIRIIFSEMLPNTLAYLAASFVVAVSAAVLATVGLEALGLGPQNANDLGMTIYWAINYDALLRGQWWWWLPPILVIVDLFVGLYLTASGLDEIANPRRRRFA